MHKIKNIEEIVKAAGIDIDNLYDDDGAQILLEPIYGVNREAAFAKYAKQMHDVLIVSCYLCNKKDGDEEKCKDCALCNLLGKIEKEEFDKKENKNNAENNRKKEKRTRWRVFFHCKSGYFLFARSKWRCDKDNFTEMQKSE